MQLLLRKVVAQQIMRRPPRSGHGGTGMSAGITSNSALLETYQDSDGNQALARVDNAMGLCGSALQIRLVNCGKTMGCHWHARHKDDPDNDYVLMLPAPRWEQDAKDAGWTLIQKLSTEGHAK